VLRVPPDAETKKCYQQHESDQRKQTIHARFS
jgi:hypothetical protein